MSELAGWDLLAAHAVGEDDDYAAARSVLAELRCSKRASEALLPIVAWAVGHKRREAARGVEAQVRSARRGLGEAHDQVQVRKQLAEEFFALGDGRRVRWGDATVEEHRQRIALLEGMRAGLAATIALHLDAIEQIVAAGVCCLREIEAVAA